MRPQDTMRERLVSHGQDITCCLTTGKKRNQYFFTGLGDSECLLNAPTTCSRALSVSCKPIGSLQSPTLPGDRPSQAPTHTLLSGPCSPNARSPLSQSLQPFHSPASSAATAVLLALLMAIVMNEDLCSSFFIGKPRAGRWIGCYFFSAIRRVQTLCPGLVEQSRRNDAPVGRDG